MTDGIKALVTHHGGKIAKSATVQRRASPRLSGPAGSILRIQRTAGNRAAQRVAGALHGKTTAGSRDSKCAPGSSLAVVQKASASGTVINNSNQTSKSRSFYMRNDADKGVTTNKSSKGYDVTDAFGTTKGSGVGGWRPNNWDFLIGKVSQDFVMGHLWNQKLGGKGKEGNLTPMTNSLNQLFYNRHEKALQIWTGNGKDYGYDFEADVTYSNSGGAASTLWNNYKSLRSSYNMLYNTLGGSKLPFMNMVGKMIPDTLVVKTRLLKDMKNGKFLVYPQQAVAYKHTMPGASKSATLSANTSKASGSRSKASISYGDKGTVANKSSLGYKVTNALGQYNGSGVGGWRPTSWNDIVGKTTYDFVMGHMWSEELGGDGETGNLAPITGSMNMQMYYGHEKMLREWTENGKEYGYDYEIFASYSNSGLAATNLWSNLCSNRKNLNEYNQMDSSGANFKKWVGLTIPEAISVNVHFLKKYMGNTYEYPKQNVNYTHF